MSTQTDGLIGWLVGGMIRRSVCSRLRNLYWSPPTESLRSPVVFYCNHHGWLDGYLMFHVVEKLKMKSLDWIEEFDTFPLFASVGGMRYSSGDIPGRATTIRKTIRQMNENGLSLILFGEGVLHRPPDVLPLGRALQLVAEKVRGVTLVPTAIYYEHSIHERPEAWISLGESHKFSSLEDCQTRLGSALEGLRKQVGDNRVFEVLAKGTGDVNERMSLRRFVRK